MATKKQVSQEPRFKKDEFLKDKSSIKDYDVINTVLKDEEEYTKSEAKKLVEAYKKGSVE